MKKFCFFRAIAIVAVLMATAVAANAQTSISCTERSTCLLDDDGDVIDCITKEEPSLFVINDAETMITHTIESTKTTYYITESVYNEEDGTVLYTVKSDLGNDYIFHIDARERMIYVFYTDDDDDLWVVRFKMKAVF